MTLPDYLPEALLASDIARWLAEDVGTGDVTTRATIPATTEATATFKAKTSGVLAGAEAARRVFAAVDPNLSVDFTSGDGDAVSAGVALGSVTGLAGPILVGERLALNILQRMSGIATATRRMVDAVAPYRARILDTRKTAPGLRLLDKWAVMIGGGTNHRIGLYDMILIKDNHADACGGLRNAIDRAAAHRARENSRLEIEVETRNLDEVRIAATHPAVDRILLDNMTSGLDASILARAVELIAGRKRTEASGNVTLETVGTIAATGVDYISVGALTHSVMAMDISLEIHVSPETSAT